MNRLTFLPTTSGIYQVLNITTGKVYIGQSLNIRRRCNSHLQKLEKGKGTVHLQASWNKYGSDSFEFASVETCEPGDLDTRETHWIARYKADNRLYGYNLESVPRGTGPRSEETKKRLSEGSSHWWRGKRLSDEHKQAIGASLQGVSKPPITDTHKENLSAAAQKRWDDTARQVRADSQDAKWKDPEYRKLMMVAHSGKRQSEATIQKRKRTRELKRQMKEVQ